MLAFQGPIHDGGVLAGLFVVFLAIIAALVGIVAGWILNRFRRK